MKITPELLEKQWSRIKSTDDNGFVQLNMQHPLEWYIGYQINNQRTLLLICDTEISMIDSSKSLIVNRRKRESDNRWVLSFELLRNEQQSVFLIFCCDIIDYSCKSTSEAEALKLVVSRHKQWNKLLETQHSGIMNEHRCKGLLGELLFLEQRITSATSALAEIQGWIGADGADQDFVYSDGWFEIKSVGASAVSVTISSLEQLDCKDDGELVIMRIDKTSPEKTGAFSLNCTIQRISSMLIDDDKAFDLFNTKLSAYGYMDLSEYSKQKYICSSTQRYLVNESFPKLKKANVPTQVSGLHYELDLPSLINWKEE